MPLEVASPEAGGSTGPTDLSGIPEDQLALAELLAVREAEGILADYGPTQLDALAYSWEFWGRPDQQWPTDPLTRILALISGRGAGKTRTGAELTRKAHTQTPRLAIAGATYDDVRKFCVEGPGGILANSPAHERPTFRAGLHELDWPNGCKGYVFAGTEPDRFRGAQVGFAWLDEFASWQYPQEAWDNLTLAFREFTQPGLQALRLITTTPKPVEALRRILGLPGVESRTVSTYRNRANLPGDWLADLTAVYEGTRIGDQELHGVFLGEVEGALWTALVIERGRLRAAPTPTGLLVPPELPDMARVAIGVDPPGRARHGKGAECGIVVCGRQATKPLPTGWVLADYSTRGRPAQWAAQVRRAWEQWGADRIYVEDNDGNPVSATQPLEQAGIPSSVLESVPPTTGSKGARAEPVAMLSEKDPPQLRWFGTFPELESQCTTYVPTAQRQQVSPDRMDAMVHGMTKLGVTRMRSTGRISSPARRAS